MGLGMMSYIGAHSLAGLIAASLFWSLGFHVFAPLSNGLILSQAQEGRRGRRMGQSNTVAAVGTLVATLLVLVMVKPLGLRASFVPTGLMILGGAICLLLLRDKEEAPRVRIVFRRRYLTYYLLTMLDGSRRQIFSTFAIFLLVRIYHVDVRAVTVLLLFNTLVTMASSLPLGRLIDRFGERSLLIGNYVILTALFAGYALVHTLLLLGVLFCLDNMLFGCSSAITTYLGRIAAPGELTPSLAMGSTANHVAAVGVPVLGGLIWYTYGYQVTFFLGAATCILSVLVALTIHRPSETDTAGL
jgi:MFS family permease